MDTNEATRQRALRLYNLGVARKRLAKEMGLSQSKVSRWLNRVSTLPIHTHALDGLLQYERKLAAALAHVPPLNQTLVEAITDAGTAPQILAFLELESVQRQAILDAKPAELSKLLEKLRSAGPTRAERAAGNTKSE